MKYLVTGANGFVGNPLCDELARRQLAFRAVLRRGGEIESKGYDVAYVSDIGPDTEWANTLQGIDVVIHLAARAHMMNDKAQDPLAEYRKINVEATENLARQAVRHGVRRLVYISSIKVNGETTQNGKSFTERDLPMPQDSYAISKMEAEQSLHAIARETGLEVVIVRPPLAYGARVKGNFAQMLQVVARGWPLPLASVKNRRSLIYVGNLVDALIACATQEAAAGQTYLVSDGEDISTPELLRSVGAAINHPARLFSCPTVVLRLVGALIGKSKQMDRLLGSLQVDTQNIRSQLEWEPPFTQQQGMRSTAEWYCGNDHV